MGFCHTGCNIHVMADKVVLTSPGGKDRHLYRPLHAVLKNNSKGCLLQTNYLHELPEKSWSSSVTMHDKDNNISAKNIIFHKSFAY